MEYPPALPLPVSEPPPPDAATALCLDCGICCEGVLYTYGQLHEDEVERIIDLGILVSEESEAPAFVQPCACHLDRRCAVYDDRPRTCVTYRCALLRSAQTGTSTFAECHRIVKEVRAVISRIYGRIGTRDPSKRIWSQAGDYLRAHMPPDSGPQDAQRAHGPLLLDLNVLALLCRRHFESKGFEGVRGI